MIQKPSVIPIGEKLHLPLKYDLSTFKNEKKKNEILLAVSEIKNVIFPHVMDPFNSGEEFLFRVSVELLLQHEEDHQRSVTSL